MIYFISSGDDGPIKIGYTNGDDIAGRMADLQVGNPEPLRLLGTKDGAYQEEQRIQKMFGKYRLRYEWFERDEEILVFIRTYCDCYMHQEPVLISSPVVFPLPVNLKKELSKFKKEISRIEYNCIKDALKATGGNISRACALIGYDRRQFKYKRDNGKKHFESGKTIKDLRAT